MLLERAFTFGLLKNNILRLGLLGLVTWVCSTLQNPWLKNKSSTPYPPKQQKELPKKQQQQKEPQKEEPQQQEEEEEEEEEYEEVEEEEEDNEDDPDEETNQNAQISAVENLNDDDDEDEEPTEKLLKPFGKDQLINLLREAADGHRDFADKIQQVADLKRRTIRA
ncbi:hypothetical protein POPTR_012G109100v4 [Populus trichocarpa]|uniref:Uncharacterized protein n=1 Tax=Populus trichocarpa TaxID=3694 RepID=A0ACC0S6R2_POPTR|nr:hypothetical protein POPTR_012G109100v4 [Populus trichocarpa]